MGAATPRGPVPGKPPKGMDEGGPKVTPAPLPSVTPSKPEYTPQGNTFSNRTGLFGGLIEAIKKTDKFKDKIKEGGKGIGLPSKVSAEKFDKLLGGLKGSSLTGGPKQDKPAPPIGEKKPPVFDDRVYAGGSSPIPGVGGHEYLNNPKYAEHRKEYYGEKSKEKEEYIKNKQEEKAASGDIGIGGGPGDIPPRFPTGPRDPRTMRDPRKEAVLFGGRPPSTKSKRPTKGSPKGGMSKAGPVDAETRNKFEEMLAYMKSFQK